MNPFVTNQTQARTYRSIPATLGGLCMLVLVSCVSTQHPQSLHHLLRTDDHCNIFSDADSNPESSSFIDRLADASGITFDIVKNGHGGVSFLLDGADLQGYAEALVEYQVDGGECRYIQLESVAGVRQKISIAKHSEAGEDGWMTARVPLSAFFLFDEAELSSVAQVTFLVAGDGALRFRNVDFLAAEGPAEDEQEQTAEKTEKEPPKNTKPTTPIARGHAVWLAAADPKLSETIEVFNEGAAHPIHFLFVEAGRLNRSVEMDMALVNYYTERLPGVLIWPTFKGRARDLSKDPEQQRLMAGSLAMLQRYRHIAGLHIDIQPIRPHVRDFLRHVDEQLAKPLSVALAEPDAEVMGICDLPVLKGFGLATDVAEFGEEANRLYDAFLQEAGAQRRNFLVGVPFAATTTEYERSVDLKTGDAKVSGFTMGDYAAQSFAAIDSIRSSEYFVGFAVWGGLDEAPRYRQSTFHPKSPADNCWRMLWQFRF